MGREVDLGIPGLGPATPLARGGFAQVYRAEQLSLRRSVAVKVLFAPPADKVAFARFERECHALGAVSHHPNIVVVHDRGFTADERPFITMEYREGGSLADRLADHGTFSPEDVRNIGIKMTEALLVAHRAGVIHRDVKPANILLSAYGEPALADFGIARIDGGHKTTTGQMSASAAHASRQVLSGDEPTVQSDVYSLGSTMLELCSGRTPFQRPGDATVWQLINRAMTEDVPNPTSFGVPEPLAGIIARALSHDLSIRHDGPATLGAELVAIGPIADEVDDRSATVALDTAPSSFASLKPDTLVDIVGPEPGRIDRTQAVVVNPAPETTGAASAAFSPGAGQGSDLSANDEVATGTSPGRRGRRMATVAVAAILLAGLAGLGAAFATGALSFGQTVPEPKLDFAQALIEPLATDRAYALSVRDAAPGALFRLVVNEQVQDDEPSSLVVYRAEPGRHRIAVEVTAPDGSSTITDPVDVYVTPGPPIGGYRVNLAAVRLRPENWSTALVQFDKLVDEGHEGLVLSESGSGEFWVFYIDGFGEDRDGAWEYCDRFDLGTDDCFAASVDRDDPDDEDNDDDDNPGTSPPDQTSTTGLSTTTTTSATSSSTSTSTTATDDGTAESSTTLE